MKKSKLIMSIITCCFALSVLAFGVYASLSVNFNLSGKISFDPHGVDASIETQVFKYNQKISHDDAYLLASNVQAKKIDEFQSIDGYTPLGDKIEYNTKNDNVYEVEYEMSGLQFDFEDCNAYVIVIHVNPNNANYDLEEHYQIVFGELTTNTEFPDGAWLAYNDKYLAIYPSAQENGLNMVLVVGVDQFKQVDETEFSLTLTLSYKDIFVLTESNYNGNLNEYVQDIVIPEMYNGENLTYFYDYSGHASGKIIMSKNVIGHSLYGQNQTFEAIVAQDNETFSSLDGSLYNKNKTTLLKYKYEGFIETVNILNFVQEIESGAINDNEILTNVYLSDNLLSEYYFSGCENVKYNIDEEYGGKYLPSKSNPYFALMDMDETKQYKTDFVLKSDCKLIAGGACSGSNITSFDFNGVDIKEIPNSLFSGCASLTSFTVPDGVTEIGGNAFSGCALTNITLPESIISIGKDAFDGCIELNFTIDSTYGGKYLPSNNNQYFALVGLDDTETYNTNFVLNSDCKVLGAGICERSEITSFDFNNADIKEIPNGMFRDCSSLSSVTISESVTKIGDQAFYHCSSLTNINIPDNVKNIGDNAFGQTNLSSIFIPKNVQTIESHPFQMIQNSNFKIYCEIQQGNIPDGWNSEWNKRDIYGREFWTDITWGVTREQYNG